MPPKLIAGIRGKYVADVADYKRSLGNMLRKRSAEDDSNFSDLRDFESTGSGSHTTERRIIAEEKELLVQAQRRGRDSSSLSELACSPSTVSKSPSGATSRKTRSSTRTRTRSLRSSNTELTSEPDDLSILTSSPIRDPTPIVRKNSKSEQSLKSATLSKVDSEKTTTETAATDALEISESNSLNLTAVLQTCRVLPSSDKQNEISERSKDESSDDADPSSDTTDDVGGEKSSKTDPTKRYLSNNDDDSEPTTTDVSCQTVILAGQIKTVPSDDQSNLSSSSPTPTNVAAKEDGKAVELSRRTPGSASIADASASASSKSLPSAVESSEVETPKSSRLSQRSFCKMAMGSRLARKLNWNLHVEPPRQSGSQPAQQIRQKIFGSLPLCSTPIVSSAPKFDVTMSSIKSPCLSPSARLEKLDKHSRVRVMIEMARKAKIAHQLHTDAVNKDTGRKGEPKSTVNTETIIVHRGEISVSSPKQVKGRSVSTAESSEQLAAAVGDSKPAVADFNAAGHDDAEQRQTKRLRLENGGPAPKKANDGAAKPVVRRSILKRGGPSLDETSKSVTFAIESSSADDCSAPMPSNSATQASVNAEQTSVKLLSLKTEEEEEVSSAYFSECETSSSQMLQSSEAPTSNIDMESKTDHDSSVDNEFNSFMSTVEAPNISWAKNRSHPMGLRRSSRNRVKRMRALVGEQAQYRVKNGLPELVGVVPGKVSQRDLLKTGVATRIQWVQKMSKKRSQAKVKSQNNETVRQPFDADVISDVSAEAFDRPNIVDADGNLSQKRLFRRSQISVVQMSDTVTGRYYIDQTSINTVPYHSLIEIKPRGECTGRIEWNQLWTVTRGSLLLTLNGKDVALIIHDSILLKTGDSFRLRNARRTNAAVFSATFPTPTAENSN